MEACGVAGMARLDEVRIGPVGSGRCGVARAGKVWWGAVRQVRRGLAGHGGARSGVAG